MMERICTWLTSSIPIQAELAGFYVPSSLKATPMNGQEEGPDYWFTIQLHASYSQTQMSYFQRLGGVKEYLCQDECYRYAYGEYRTFEEAKIHLAEELLFHSC